MKLLFWHKAKGFFWIRFLDRGFSIADSRIHKPLFSERNGYAKVIRIGPYAIRYLKLYQCLKVNKPEAKADKEGVEG